MPPWTRAASPPIGQWLQYRADARKSASVEDGNQSVPLVGWRAQIDGPVRSSASIVGNIVLLGTHHTGAFDARDREGGGSGRSASTAHQTGGEGRIVVGIRGQRQHLGAPGWPPRTADRRHL
jgi:hypothetical protein